MAIAKLNDWFENGKDYEAGVLIYQEHGRSTVLKKILSKVQNNYNTNKLEAELKKLLDKNQVKPAFVKSKVKVVRAKKRTEIVQKPLPQPIKSHPPVKRYSEVQLPGYDFESLPEQLKYENQLRINLYKEANSLHYQLDSLEDPVRIKNSIDIILQNFIKIDQYWERLDYWGKYKIILPVIEESDKPEKKEYSDPFEMIRTRNNIRGYISKAKKRLLTLKDNQKIAETHRKIALWEIELNDLEQKING